MNIAKFETKQEYLDYCKDNQVYNIPSKYASFYTYISNGIERETYFEKLHESVCYVSTEPKSYPCILTWIEIDSDNSIYGCFVYPSNFNI